jgi:hypothetical protein
VTREIAVALTLAIRFNQEGAGQWSEDFRLKAEATRGVRGHLRPVRTSLNGPDTCFQLNSLAAFGGVVERTCGCPRSGR